jgi:hypothetical protein
VQLLKRSCLWAGSTNYIVVSEVCTVADTTGPYTGDGNSNNFLCTSQCLLDVSHSEMGTSRTGDTCGLQCT